jgi:hypothetical protein
MKPNASPLVSYTSALPNPIMIDIRSKLSNTALIGFAGGRFFDVTCPKLQYSH